MHYNSGKPEHYTAQLLREIQDNWHRGQVVLGYSTIQDPFNLRHGTVVGEGHQWVVYDAE